MKHLPSFLPHLSSNPWTDPSPNSFQLASAPPNSKAAQHPSFPGPGLGTAHGPLARLQLRAADPSKRWQRLSHLSADQMLEGQDTTLVNTCVISIKNTALYAQKSPEKNQKLNFLGRVQLDTQNEWHSTFHTCIEQKNQTWTTWN